MPDLKTTRWVQLHNLKLKKVSPSLTGPIASGSEPATAVTLNFKIPAGAAADVSGKRQAVLSSALPYALRFGGETASLVAASGVKLQTGAKFKGKGKKAVKLVLPEKYSFNLVTKGSLAVGECARASAASWQHAPHATHRRGLAMPLVKHRQAPHVHPPHANPHPQSVRTATAARCRPTTPPTRAAASAASALLVPASACARPAARARTLA
jgi:hypothetical protein